MKEPLLAALLNFSFSGAGYIYIGKRRLFGWLLISSFLMSALSATLNVLLLFYRDAFLTWPSGAQQLLMVLPGILACLALLTLATGLAVDAFYEAKQDDNSRLK